jgi:hypothetical protein
MKSSSSSGQIGGKPRNATADITPRPTLESKSIEANASVVAVNLTAAKPDAQATAPSASRQNRPDPSNAWDPTAPRIPQVTIPCPKCGAAVREVARFST